MAEPVTLACAPQGTSPSTGAGTAGASWIAARGRSRSGEPVRPARPGLPSLAGDPAGPSPVLGDPAPVLGNPSAVIGYSSRRPAPVAPQPAPVLGEQLPPAAAVC